MASINDIMKNKKELQGKMPIPTFLEMPNINTDYKHTMNDFYNSNPDLAPNNQQQTFEVEGEKKGIDPNLAYEMLEQYKNALDRQQQLAKIQSIFAPIQKALGQQATNLGRERLAYRAKALQNPYLAGVAPGYKSPLENTSYSDIMVALASNKLGNVEKLNQLRGNMVAAQEAGLDPATAFGTKDQITNLAGIIKANIGAEAKRDVANTYLEKAKYVQDAKNKIADLDRQYKYYAKNGDWATALKIQAMKGQIQTNVANIMAGSKLQGSALTALGQYMGMQPTGYNPSQEDVSNLINVLKQYPEIINGLQDK